jgi:hypothetical protein
MQEARQVSFPNTNLEVKVVSAIPFRERVLNAGFRCVGILLGESLKGLQDDNQAAHHEIRPKVFYVHPASTNSSVYPAEADGFAKTPSGWPSTPRPQCSFGEIRRFTS